jgi:putative transcriptional regulator
MQQKQPDIKLDTETRERLERLKSGCVLLAREALKDPNFDATVVLICVYGEEGAYGMVVNRPSHMPLSEVFDGFGGKNKVRKVYIGGPVRQDELQVIQVTDTPAEDAFQVCPRVYLGGQWEDLQRLLESDETSSYLFLGYSGWAPEQLESEIIAGAWDVYTVNVARFLAEAQKHWGGDTEEIRKRLVELQA